MLSLRVFGGLKFVVRYFCQFSIPKTVHASKRMSSVLLVGSSIWYGVSFKLRMLNQCYVLW